MAKPNNLGTIWGVNGVIVDPGDVKFETGWVAEIPSYKIMNYVDNKHSSALANANKYGVMEWDGETFYVLGSRAIHLGILYKCDVVSSVNEEPGVSVNWIDIRQELIDRIEAVITDLDGYIKQDTDVSVGNLTVSGSLNATAIEATNEATVDGIHISSGFSSNIYNPTIAQNAYVTPPKGLYVVGAISYAKYAPDYTTSTIINAYAEPLSPVLFFDGVKSRLYATSLSSPILYKL